MQGVSAVAVTSGANMNFDRLRLVTELAGIGALKEAMLATTMPERQGSFKDFLDIALENTDLQITEFKYRCGVIGIMSPFENMALQSFHLASHFVAAPSQAGEQCNMVCTHGMSCIQHTSS